MTDDLPLSIGDAASAIRSRHISSEELTSAFLARADRIDGSLSVYLTRFDDHALAAARSADRDLASGHDLGPLHGIPIAVKDIISTSEGPTSGQSRVKPPGWNFVGDAAVVGRLRRAGAVIMGKTTTMELAIGLPDPSAAGPLPRNPWNVAHWAGGSSSGSASGVAAGLFLGSVGSDTGGSIRLPAAFCGVTGLMPTFGLVPVSGCFPVGYTIDRIGPLARGAEDCAAMLAAMVDPTANSSQSPTVGVDSLQGVRLGVVEPPAGSGNPGFAPRFTETLQVFRSLGGDLRSVQLPHYDATVLANFLTMGAEALSTYRQVLMEQWSDFGRPTRARVAMAELIPSGHYVQAQRVRAMAQLGLAELFATVDVVVMPTATSTAPSLAGSGIEIEAVLSTTFTPYWDAIGNPALSFPVGFGPAGLPYGCQLAGPPYSEGTLLRTAAAYQAATGWHQRVPEPSIQSAGPSAQTDAAWRGVDSPLSAEARRIEERLSASGFPIPEAERHYLASHYEGLLARMSLLFGTEVDLRMALALSVNPAIDD